MEIFIKLIKPSAGPRVWRVSVSLTSRYGFSSRLIIFGLKKKLATAQIPMPSRARMSLALNSSRCSPRLIDESGRDFLSLLLAICFCLSRFIVAV